MVADVLLSPINRSSYREMTGVIINICNTAVNYLKSIFGTIISSFGNLTQ